MVASGAPAGGAQCSQQADRTWYPHLYAWTPRSWRRDRPQRSLPNAAPRRGGELGAAAPLGPYATGAGCEIKAFTSGAPSGLTQHGRCQSLAQVGAPKLWKIGFAGSLLPPNTDPIRNHVSRKAR